MRIGFVSMPLCGHLNPMTKTRGLDVAADIIEQAFLTRADVAHVHAK